MADLSDLANQLAQILQAIAQTGVLPVQNNTKITAWRTLCPVANTAYQLSPKPIPYDQALVIKALPANLGQIFVGANAAECVNINSSYVLIANEAIAYKIAISDTIWISAAIAGEGVVCTVEQKGG